jgi:hypothetical protein
MNYSWDGRCMGKVPTKRHETPDEFLWNLEI